MPGHCYAMLQAIPELRDPGENGSYFSVQGFPNNCLNPAREETYRVLETIFDELIELFPSKIIHIGADEVPLGAWSGSPEALARLARDRRRGAGHRACQAPQRRHQHAWRRRDRRIGRGGAAGGVPEADTDFPRLARLRHRRLAGGRARQCHRQGQMLLCSAGATVEVSAALAGEGYDMVVCPGQVYYLDMANSPAWSEPGAGWAGWSDPEKLYTLRSGRRLDRGAEEASSSACSAASGRSR